MLDCFFERGKGQFFPIIMTYLKQSSIWSNRSSKKKKKKRYMIKSLYNHTRSSVQTDTYIITLINFSYQINQ